MGSATEPPGQEVADQPGRDRPVRLQRPSGIVCYSAGAFGGVRAAMQLRMSLAEMGMPSVPSLLPIPRIGETLTADGQGSERIIRSRDRFLDEFLWYARALRPAKAAGTPY